MSGIQSPEWAEIRRILDSQKETFQIQLDHINEKIKEMSKILNELTEGNAVHRVKLEQLKEHTDRIEMNLIALSKIEQLERDNDDIREEMKRADHNLEKRLNLMEETKNKFLNALIQINNKVDNLIREKNQEENGEEDWKSRISVVLMKHLPIILLTIVVIILLLGVFLMNVPTSSLREIISLFSVPPPSAP